MNEENEWPLGKLNPVTFLKSGSRGLLRLKISLSIFKIATVVMPITITSKAIALFFLIKKITINIVYAGNKNAEDPKKVTILKNLVAKGDRKDKTAWAIAVSNPLSCSRTISSVMITNKTRVTKNTTIARIN